MDPGLELMIFMGVILKIPVAAACWLIYWALKATPDAVEGEGGSEDHGRRRFRRQPRRPRGPRRGPPHSPDALPLPCPEQGVLRVARAGALRVRSTPPSGRH